MDETTEQCAIRELEKETGMKVTELHQIGTYSKVDRDPRGRTVTVVYLVVIDKPLPLIGQDDAAQVFSPKITLFYRILSPNSHFYRIWKQNTRI